MKIVTSKNFMQQAVVLPLPGLPRMLLREFFAAIDGDTGAEGVWRAEAFSTWHYLPQEVKESDWEEEEIEDRFILASCCEKRKYSTISQDSDEGKELVRRLDGCSCLVHCPFATAWFSVHMVRRPVLVCHPHWEKVNRVWAASVWVQER